MTSLFEILYRVLTLTRRRNSLLFAVVILISFSPSSYKHATIQ